MIKEEVGDGERRWGLDGVGEVMGDEGSKAFDNETGNRE